MDPADAPCNRRQFLKTVALTPAVLCMLDRLHSESGGQVTIDSIDVHPARYPMTGYFKFFSGAHGSRGRAAVFVKVTASDGTVGWGQSVPIARWSYETLETCTTALRDYFAPQLIGIDPADIAGIHAIMDRTIAGAFSTGMPIARAGLDIALWDLAGRRQGKSIPELWGLEARDRLELSWTVNARRLDDVDAIIDAGLERGYRNFNIKVAPDPGFDVELARRVRKRAPEGFLWADANGGYDPEAALAVAPRLADAGVDVLEAPLRPNRLSGYRALVRQGALPIFMDEGVVSAVELEEFIELKMLDGVAMKPSRCGGLTSNKEQIELVKRHDLLWLGSGLTDPDLSLAACLQLYAAFGLDRPAALNGPQFLTADVLRKPIEIRDGHAVVPRGAGLGVEVDEEKVAELVRRSAR